MGLRSLEEKAALSLDMVKRAADRGNDSVADAYQARADDAQAAAELMRQLISRMGEVRPPDEEAAGR